MTLARWTQPSGPLCLWQCLQYHQYRIVEKLKQYWPILANLHSLSSHEEVGGPVQKWSQHLDLKSIFIAKIAKSMENENHLHTTCEQQWPQWAAPPVENGCTGCQGEARQKPFSLWCTQLSAQYAWWSCVGCQIHPHHHHDHHALGYHLVMGVSARAAAASLSSWNCIIW